MAARIIGELPRRVLPGASNGRDGRWALALAFHPQLLEVQVALDPRQASSSISPRLPQLEHGAALGVDHRAADQAVLQQLLLRRLVTWLAVAVCSSCVCSR